MRDYCKRAYYHWMYGGGLSVVQRFAACAYAVYLVWRIK